MGTVHFRFGLSSGHAASTETGAGAHFRKKTVGNVVGPAEQNTKEK